MSVAVPAAGDTVKVVDQTSEYRNHSGTVTQALGGAPVQFKVTLAHHAKPVLLRLTQIKVIGTANGTPVSSQDSSTDPDGTINNSLVTPTGREKRDVVGAGFNPVMSRPPRRSPRR